MISGFSARKKPSSVGLDITSESIAATEVENGGSVGRTAIVPLQPGVVKEGDLVNREVLSDALKDLFSRHKLGKTVRVGVANQRVVVRSLQLPLIEDEEELDTAVRFRAQEAIPMPLEQAVLDHQVVAKRDGHDGNKVMDVLAVAARRDMVAGLLEAVRGAGLQPVAIDLSAFGMIRALKDRSAPLPVQGDVPLPTSLYCHLGDVTNLAVARGDECVFARVSPFGIETIADRLASRKGVAIDEARELLMEVGLEEDVELFSEKGADLAREVLEEGATKLAEELRMSMDFYGAQEGVTPVDRVVLCGPGSTIPGLPERIQAGLTLDVSVDLPAALSHLDQEDAARLTVSYGLALEE
ncbi:MAG TPA: type IV pilus assembly protein PilM [Solirubrobacterales bacterium]|nr:type IV pilus assembly protein PilM [Solirubrobacterales bacterium]